MVTAKKAATSASQAKKPGTAVALWEQEMAAAAKRQVALEKPMGLFKQVVMSGGNMFIDDKPVAGNKMRVVVLASAHENQWFKHVYVQGQPGVPACYAFGDNKIEDPEELEARMAPSDGVDEKQSERCADCELNKMGSAETGRGKACGNVRRLILVTEDSLTSADAMAEAEARSVKVSVTSVRNWVNFVHEIGEMGRMPYGVVAEMSVVPDKKWIQQIHFKFEELVAFDQPLYEAAMKRVRQAEKDIVTPYPKLEDQGEPPAKNSRMAQKISGPSNGRKAGAAAPAATKPAQGARR